MVDKIKVKKYTISDHIAKKIDKEIEKYNTQKNKNKMGIKKLEKAREEYYTK